MQNRLRHIAMFMHGGLAPPESTSHVPAITGLVKRLAEQFDITVYLMNGPPGPGEPFECGKAHVKFIRPRHGDSNVTLIVRTLQEYWVDHRSSRYSLVHGFWALPGGLAAVLAGKVSGRPQIVSVLGGEAAHLPEIQYGNMVRLAPRTATLWTCRHATAITLLTRYQLEGLSRYHLDRSENLHIVPFGVDSSLFHCASRGPALPPYNFIHVGHANRVKDQTMLLRAFQRISEHLDCRLRIIGEDTLNGSLKRCAGELGISHLVTFAGFVRNEDLHQHFAWAHVLLHSSLYEGQGVVFAEAAASGVPICGTRVGLLSDLGPPAAISVEPGNHEMLALGVLELLGDEVRMQRLRSEAKHWADTHSADWTAARFADVYDQFLRKQ